MAAAEEQPEKTLSLQEFVTYRVARLNARLNAQAAKILNEHGGLTLSQWRVLVVLDEHRQITPAEFVRMTGLDKAQVSRTMKQMIASGAVATAPDKTDQRVRVLTMTRRGRRLFDAARAAMRARQARLRNALTPAERVAFFAALDKLEATIDGVGAT